MTHLTARLARLEARLQAGETPQVPPWQPGATDDAAVRALLAERGFVAARAPAGQPWTTAQALAAALLHDPPWLTDFANRRDAYHDGRADQTGTWGQVRMRIGVYSHMPAGSSSWDYRVFDHYAWDLFLQMLALPAASLQRAWTVLLRDRVREGAPAALTAAEIAAMAGELARAGVPPTWYDLGR